MDIQLITPTIFHIVAYLNLVAWVGVIVSVLAAVTKPAFWPALKKRVAPHAKLLAFIITAFSSLASMFLSNIAGYNPCLLCWWQRIFMYPLAIILLVSLIYDWRKKQLPVKAYALTLASIGAAIALYHYAMQRIPLLQGTVPCLQDASCSTMYLGYWGFYSIPLMAFTGFIGAIVLLSVYAPAEKVK